MRGGYVGAAMTHRNGLSLSIGAMHNELDALEHAIHGLTEDHLRVASDVMLKTDLEEIKKHADRISALCGAEIESLVTRLNRNAKVAS